ncbi:ATP-binding protein [Streptomyces sp. CC224B]|uniref:ATP-binding protein n=1 Tax=Streptomyces sp. CC224B TaxID=3044571 RepID=UPI0024A8A59E|nr:ATP-binding protein [Streptomyces sp. CC224B]
MPFFEERAGGLRCVLPFEAAPAELSLLREAARRALEQWGMGAVAEEAELAVTELATNVIEHVGEGSPATLVLESTGHRLRVEVHDKSPGRPVLRTACTVAERGRGLQMLAAMSEEWGAELTPAGKMVWCELALGSAQHRLRVQRAVMIINEYRRVAGSASVMVPTAAVLEESATDAITDLLHWLVAQGGDPDEALDRALMHYEAEAGAA